MTEPMNKLGLVRYLRIVFAMNIIIVGIMGFVSSRYYEESLIANRKLKMENTRLIQELSRYKTEKPAQASGGSNGIEPNEGGDNHPAGVREDNR